jgi:hypothetical protein
VGIERTSPREPDHDVLVGEWIVAGILGVICGLLGAYTVAWISRATVASAVESPTHYIDAVTGLLLAGSILVSSGAVWTWSGRRGTVLRRRILVTAAVLGVAAVVATILFEIVIIETVGV